MVEFWVLRVMLVADGVLTGLSRDRACSIDANGPGILWPPADDRFLVKGAARPSLCNYMGSAGTSVSRHG